MKAFPVPHDPQSPPDAPPDLRQVVIRHMLFGFGCVFVTLGAIGMVVPMMPGTIFLILAAWCFARSSPRFEAWLLNHRYLGPSVRRWQETGAIPLFAKVFALASFVGSWFGTRYLGAPVYVLWGLAILFVVLSIYMVTRPNE
ncbi:hypothetical protein GCM10007301_34620 [Azorhizobium oxalatiphilum]|uniref:DUF454 domain-containing protein n=1 Tax=Azorhizobium oxalatiphilum TaxID=980631 RepID=A0A917FDU8_9HYPH|nr:YbaN family protein [Azorhizobium oxalatiphilum]GGF71948.1 hypothetical protein GCM10007301_34620 [Azorhizobium oxalatiphilum]